MKLSSASPRGQLAGEPAIPTSHTYYCAPGFAVEKGILVRQVKSVEILGRKRHTVHRSRLSGFPRPWESTQPHEP